MTYAYNATRGNIPLMILVHLTYNLSGRFVSIDPYYHVAYGILFLIAALLLSRLRPAPPIVEPIPGWSHDTHDPAQAPGNLPL